MVCILNRKLFEISKLYLDLKFMYSPKFVDCVKFFEIGFIIKNLFNSKDK